MNAADAAWVAAEEVAWTAYESAMEAAEATWNASEAVAWAAYQAAMAAAMANWVAAEAAAAATLAAANAGGNGGLPVQPASAPVAAPPAGGRDELFVYDNGDTELDDNLREAANDYRNSLGARTLKALNGLLDEYVKQNGKVKTMVIGDHAGRDSLKQHFGLGVVIPLDWYRYFARRMDANGTIVLTGCSAAKNREFVQSIADATGLTVIAADGSVWWIPAEIDGLDFWTSGAWQTFTPSGQQPNSTPESHGLRQGIRTAPNP